MVLIPIFLFISDVEHIFMYLLLICMSFLEKSLFRIYVNFLKSDWFFFFFFFLLLECMSYLYILDISPLSDICLENVLGCLFILLIVSFAV